MKVVHLSTYDIAGGAARAAYRLHSGLRRLGHDSLMYVYRQRSNDPTVTAFKPPKDLPTRLRARLRRERIRRSFARYGASRPPGYERFSDDCTVHGSELVAQLPPGDVINLHSIADFVDYRSFFTRVPQHTPIVWTLHDMYPFTGGCHYDHGCGKYVSGCGSCPQLGSSDSADLSNQIWQRKRKVFEQIESNRLHLVALNNWMATEVKRSPLLQKYPVVVIPNGLDVDDFAPRDRRYARDVLGVPQDAKVLLFVASSVENRRKGFALLTKVVARLKDSANLWLISLGTGDQNVSQEIPHIHLGSVGNDRLLSVVYSAADVFVIPSLQDNLPNTVLESLACGTPVVGFDVGGIPDMVRPGVTGLLAPATDVAAMSNAIRRLLSNEAARLEMAINCRRVAVKEYALEVQAARYTELYGRILDRDS